MKKYVLSLSFFTAIALQLAAQSDYKIMDVNNNDITGTTIQVFGAPKSSYTGTYHVLNTTGGNLSTRARKEEVSMADSSTSSICYGGSCFGPATYVSPCKIDTSGKANVLNGDFNFGPSMTSSTIRYCVTNCSNTADSAFIVVVYNPSPAGIASYSLNYSLSEPFPNPASTLLSFNYKVGSTQGNSQIMVYNLLGSLISSVDLSEAAGTVKLDVAELESGMYFYTFLINGKAVVSKKFIIRH